MSTESQPKPLHVLHFEAQNVMGVKAINVTFPPSGVFRFGGENGAGKSSAINALFGVFSGKGPEALPIRHGEQEGFAQADLGDILCTVKYRYDKKGEVIRELKVTNKDGASYSSPQELLNKLVSKFSFDPFAFIGEKPTEREEIFRKALPLDREKLAELNTKHDEAFDKRKEIKKELTRIVHQNDEIIEYPEAPEEEVSIADLSRQLEEANATNTGINEKNSKLAVTDGVLATRATRQGELDAEVEKLKLSLAEAERSASAYLANTADQTKTRNEYAKTLEGLTLIDTTDLTTQINGAEEINQQVRANKQKAEGRKTFEAKDEERAEQEKIIMACRKEINAMTTAAVNEANLAIPGLRFVGDEKDEDGNVLVKGGLYVDDIPFDQVNTADQLKLSVALAVKENPRLKIFRVKHAEALTPASIEILHGLALDSECLILMETPLSRKDVAGGFRSVEVFMEEGEAVEMPTPENTEVA
jgi:hypothetical protein